jgi:hypothetical protein
MKRDMDLVRTILLEVEEHESPTGVVDLKAPGYSPEQIAYHVKLLMQAGLIEGHNASGMQNFRWIATSLTWRGHEFPEAARNDSVWQRVKAELKDRSMSLPFDLIQQLAIKIAAGYMGLTP